MKLEKLNDTLVQHVNRIDQLLGAIDDELRVASELEDELNPDFNYIQKGVDHSLRCGLRNAGNSDRLLSDRIVSLRATSNMIEDMLEHVTKLRTLDL